jgi:hypothetical protein
VLIWCSATTLATLSLNYKADTAAAAVVAAAAAVEMGADLVPCYHFGNSRLFGWGPKSLEPLARRHRVALGFLKGRWGLPLPLPER